jgi:hypothetical protein
MLLHVSAQSPFSRSYTNAVTTYSNKIISQQSYKIIYWNLHILYVWLFNNLLLVVTTMVQLTEDGNCAEICRRILILQCIKYRIAHLLVLIELVNQKIPFVFEGVEKILEQLSDCRNLKFIAQWSCTLLSICTFRMLAIRVHLLTITFWSAVDRVRMRSSESTSPFFIKFSSGVRQ